MLNRTILLIQLQNIILWYYDIKGFSMSILCDVTKRFLATVSVSVMLLLLCTALRYYVLFLVFTYPLLEFVNCVTWLRVQMWGEPAGTDVRAGPLYFCPARRLFQ